MKVNERNARIFDLTVEIHERLHGMENMEAIRRVAEIQRLVTPKPRAAPPTNTEK